MSKSKLREHAEKYAHRIQAYERVALRRWLRKDCGLDDLPEHLYLNWSKEQLVDEVNRAGGNATELLSQAHGDITARIAEGR